MEKITVSVDESQYDRIEQRVDDNRAENRSQALRQEIRATNDKSSRRKNIEVAANVLGFVGIMMIGLTFFMADSIRVVSLVPIIGSLTLFVTGFLIDESIVVRAKEVVLQ